MLTGPGLMNAFRVEEDMPIESGMLTRSLEGAQQKVETYYYDIRKQCSSTTR
jgi:preprotein translocase subunit SecA